MRRVLVIVLILLFPLNVFALSLSASLFQADSAMDVQEPAVLAVTVQPADGHACELACDIDPDEPPGHQDLHDIIHLEAALRQAGPADRSMACHDARARCCCLPPPVKPPRA